MISSCVKCIKTSKTPARFDPPLGAPRFLNLLESSSPIFLGVSFDAIGPIKFLLKRGARGAKTISKGYALIAICCVTKFVSYYLMEDIQKVDIEMAISTHCARYRSPRFILTDNGTSNDILENHQKSIVEVLQQKRVNGNIASFASIFESRGVNNKSI